MNVTKAKYIGDYTVKVWFDSGEIRTVDFSAVVLMSSNALVAQFADKTKFRQFTIDDGVLTWNNDMDFAPEALYYATNGLQHKGNSDDEN